MLIVSMIFFSLIYRFIKIRFADIEDFGFCYRVFSKARYEFKQNIYPKYSAFETVVAYGGYCTLNTIQVKILFHYPE